MILDENRLELYLGGLWSKIHVSMRNNRLREAHLACFLLIWTVRLFMQDKSLAAPAYNRLGIVYAKQKKYRSAIRCFKRAILLEESLSGYHNLGLAYHQRGNYVKAKDYFTKAIDMDPSNFQRHKALAITEEKLGNTGAVIEHLKAILKYENTPRNKKMYIQALHGMEGDRKLTKEVLDALRHNKVEWQAEQIDLFGERMASLRYYAEVLGGLIGSMQKNSGMQLRTKRAYQYAVVYLQHLDATIELLAKNHSGSALTLARAMYELYVRLEYAFQQKNTRGFGEQDLYALNKRLKAQERLLKRERDSERDISRISEECRIIKNQMKSIRSRYSNLGLAPDFSKIEEIVLAGKAELDRYTDFYNKGSEVAHASAQYIERVSNNAGHTRVGLFLDSYELAQLVTGLTSGLIISLGEVPEVSDRLRTKLKKKIQKLQTPTKP